MTEHSSLHRADLSIIIVNWNSADYVSACIGSIQRETPLLSYQIIVVDNASFDGCRERLKAQHPTVLFVQSEENLGFARANNLGVQYANGKLLLFLNPDTEVLDQALERLHACFSQLQDVGVLGCRLLNSDGSVQTSSVLPFPTAFNQAFGTELFEPWFGGPRWRQQQSHTATPSGAVAVEAVSGACMMIRRDLFLVLGGFASEYFMYGEDVDLCFRASANGHRNYHCRDATITHHGGGSSQKRPSSFSIVMMRESVSLLLRRSRGQYASIQYRIFMTLSSLMRIVLLGALSPFWLAGGDSNRWTASLNKWATILLWSTGIVRARPDVVEPRVKAPQLQP